MLFALFAARADCWLVPSSVCQDAQGLGSKSAPSSQILLAPLQGAHPSQVQDLALVPVDFYKILVSTFLQLL